MLSYLKLHKEKKKQREKRLKKERNIQRNRPQYKYKLEINEDGGWKSVVGFKSRAEVDEHIEAHDKIRRENTSNIIEGRITNLKTGRQVAHIPAHDTDMPVNRKSTSGSENINRKENSTA